MAFLAKRGRATLKHNEPAGAFFHDVEIEGLRFKVRNRMVLTTESHPI